MNIVTNFVPNVTLTSADLDPPWMNSFMKDFISVTDNFYQKFIPKDNNMYHFCAFKNLHNHLNHSIQTTKQNYLSKIAKNLDDPNTESKCYWSLYKALLNGKKIHCIPPLFHGSKHILHLLYNFHLDV